MMKSGQLNTMNDVITKSANSCTKAFGLLNDILYYSQRGNRNRFRKSNDQFGRRNSFQRTVLSEAIITIIVSIKIETIIEALI